MQTVFTFVFLFRFENGGTCDNKVTSGRSFASR